MSGVPVRERHPLDAAVREVSADPGRTWGVREAVLGVLAVPVSLGVGLLVIVLVPGLPGLAGTSVAMLALTVLTVLLARRAARQSGGARRALGLGPPRPSDVGRHAQGSGPEAVVLAVATGVFGVGLCVLVRRTGRLAPAIGVHAVRNALALGATLLV